MIFLKRIGSYLADFFKTHTILAIILITVIVMLSVWTPIAIYLFKSASGTQSENASENSFSQATGSSVFFANGNKGDSSKEDDISKDTDTTNSSGTSNNSLTGNNSDLSDSSSSKDNDSTGNTSSNVKPIRNVKKIICWGDSVTANNYPAFLNDLLGEQYEVLNAGAGGEQSQTIAARQGALKVYTTKEFVFDVDVATIDIGTDRNHGMCVEDGTPLDIAMDSSSLNNQVSCKVVYINGKEYVLSIKSNGSSVNNGIFQLSRGDYDYSKKVVIPKGSEVVFSSALEQEKGTHCEIFLIGFNDGSNPTEELVNKVVERLKAMAKRQGDDNYIVIINYHSAVFKEPFINAFGEKALDFGAAITEHGCYMAGASKLTDLDIERISKGTVPPCLKWDNNPLEVHLNSIGQKYLATVVYEKGVELGYWD